MGKTLTDIVISSGFLFFTGMFGLVSADYNLKYREAEEELKKIEIGSTNYKFLSDKKFNNDLGFSILLGLAALTASSGIYFASRKKDE